MIIHAAHTRQGVTLLEVLVAIFIMGVGLLAILTLFPLGALSMARAVREDRAAAIAANEAAWANAIDLRNDGATSAALGLTPPKIGTLTPKGPNPEGPGYPIYVDPTYVVLGSNRLGAVPGTLAPLPEWCATPGLRRISPSLVSQQPGLQAQAIARWFTFQDEIQFDTLGSPLPGGGSVTRPGTYSCAILARRPLSGNPTLTDISVIVYANRTTDSLAGESPPFITARSNKPVPPNVLGSKNTNLIGLDYTGRTKPIIRKGGWVLDTTYQEFNANNVQVQPGTGTFGTVNANFYQVASVTDTGPTTINLELESPLLADVQTLMIMENVVTVLKRGASWRP